MHFHRFASYRVLQKINIDQATGFIYSVLFTAQRNNKIQQRYGE